MPDVVSGLSIGQVAERTGLSVHALRFYEREALLANPVARGPERRRVYREQDVEWLRICTNLRASVCRWRPSAGAPTSCGKETETNRSDSPCCVSTESR